MRKKFLGILLTMCVLVAVVPSVNANDEYLKYGSNLYYSVNDDATITITGCDNLATYVNIPSYINGKPVTIIDNYAFSECSVLKKISIPNNVKSIREGAFFDCKALSEIALPNSITHISLYAFHGCESLRSISIPKSVISIGISSFEGCNSLIDINVQEDNTQFSSIDGVLFNKSQTQLICFPAGKDESNYTVPNNTVSIASSAFYGCKLLNTITISDGVNQIGSYAFAHCENLKNISLPASLTEIGSCAFRYCTNLKEIFLPVSVNKIKSGVFLDCQSLLAINVDENNQYYTSQNGVLFDKSKSKIICFPSNKEISNYEVSNSVSRIEEFAFAGCNQIINLTIPSNITYIGEETFTGCEKLSNIIVESDNPTFTSINGVLFDKALSTLLCYPSGKTDSCYTVPTNVKSIGSVAFAGCKYLNNIVLSENVASIDYGAFCNCTALKDISIPKNVKYIGSIAFKDCVSLCNMQLSDSMTYISYCTFQNCNALRSIVIPKTVTSIANGAFDNCNAMKDVYYSGSEDDWDDIYI